MATVVNLYTNPSFETATSGAIVVRTNHCANPAFETNTTGWTATGSSTLTREIATPMFGVASGKMTGNGTIYYEFSVTVGETITASLYYTTDGSLSSAPTMYITGTPAVSATVVLSQSQPTALRAVVTAPPATSTGTLRLYVDATTLTGSDIIYVDRVLIEKSTSLRPYFDGATTDELGYDYAWTGSANATTSTAKAATTTLRTNLSTNPRAISGGFSNINSGTWDTAFVTTGVPTHPLGLTTALQGNVASGQTSTLGLSINNLDNLDTSGPDRRNGIWVYSVAAGYEVKATGGFPVTALTASTWTYVRTSSTIAASTSSALDVGKTSGNASSSDLIYVTGCMSEAGDYVGQYFDGTMSTSGDYITAWTGTVNASTTEIKGVSVVGVTSGAIQSHEWSSAGVRSIRVPSGATTNTFASISTGVLTAGTYSLTAKLRMNSVQASGTSSRARKVYISDGVTSPIVSAAAPNAVGVHTIQMNFTLPNDATEFFLYNGAPVDGEDVWWDDLLVVSGPYFGGYFDGDSLYSVWGGTAHASASTFTEPAVVSGYTVSGLTIGNAYTALLVVWRDPDSPVVAATNDGINYSDPVTTLGSWVETRHTFVADATTEIVGIVRTDTNVGRVYIGGAALVEVDDVNSPYEGPYFDGSFTSDTLATYAWTGSANASTSTRTMAQDFDEEVPDPFGTAEANSSKSKLDIKYRSGWVG